MGFIGIIIFIFGSLTQLIPQINKLHIIDKEYVGISGVDEVGIDDDYGSGTESNYSNCFIFKNDDTRKDFELEKLKNKHDEINEREFIYWQTGMSAGYNPKYISYYNGSKSFSDRIYLYCTVGPIMLFENFIDALKNALLFMIFPLIRLFFKKPIKYKNFTAFKEDIIEKTESKSKYDNYDY